MSKVGDNIRSAERKAYLKAHKDEYPFPLDGSDWAREVREHQFLDRHPHCKCEGCTNLLTRLHESKSLLNRQRTVILRAMHHWFIHDLKQAYWLNDQLTAEELAKLKVKLQEHEEESLDSTEKKWLSHKTYARPDHPESLAGDRREHEPIRLKGRKEALPLRISGSPEPRRIVQDEHNVPAVDPEWIQSVVACDSTVDVDSLPDWDI